MHKGGSCPGTIFALLGFAGIVLPGKGQIARAFEIYVERNLPFGDAYHAMLAERWQATEIVSFDREFDRVPFVTRVEPDASGVLLPASR